MPSQKSGIEIPNTTKLSVSLCAHRPPVAARTPSGIPTNTARSIDSAVTLAGDRQALGEQFGERRVAHHVAPQVAMKEGPDPAQVLMKEALIEAELASHLGHVGFRRVKAQHGAHRIAGHEPKDQEDKDAHDKQRRNREKHPTQDEGKMAAHRRRLSPLLARSRELADEIFGQLEMARGDVGGGGVASFGHRGHESLMLADGDLPGFVGIGFGAEIERDPGAQIER